MWPDSLTDHRDPRMMSAGNICGLKGVKSFLANSVRKSNGTGVRKSIGAKMMKADKYIWYSLFVQILLFVTTLMTTDNLCWLTDSVRKSKDTRMMTADNLFGLTV